MVGGELIADMMKHNDNRITRSVSSDQTPEEFLTDLYWSALCRAPTAHETAVVGDYIRSKADPKAAFEDVLWAVLNSNEFLLRQ